MKYQRAVFEEHLIAAMTSGLRQKGPNYQLPQSLAMEYARLCYNTGISDAMSLLKDSDALSKTTSVHDLAEALSSLHILQKELHEKTN